MESSRTSTDCGSVKSTNGNYCEVAASGVLTSNRSDVVTIVEKGAPVDGGTDYQLEMPMPPPTITRKSEDITLEKILALFGDDNFIDRPLCHTVCFGDEEDLSPSDYKECHFSRTIDCDGEDPWITTCYDFRRSLFVAIVSGMQSGMAMTEYLVARIGWKRALECNTEVRRHLNSGAGCLATAVRSCFADNPSHEQSTIHTIDKYGDFVRGVIGYAAPELADIQGSPKVYSWYRTSVMIHRAILEFIQSFTPDVCDPDDHSFGKWSRCIFCCRRYRNSHEAKSVKSCPRCKNMLFSTVAHRLNDIMLTSNVLAVRGGAFTPLKLVPIMDYLRSIMEAQPQMQSMRNMFVSPTLTNKAENTLDDASNVLSGIQAMLGELDTRTKDVPALIDQLTKASRQAESGFDSMGFYYKTAAGISIAFSVLSLILIIASTLWKQRAPVPEPQANDQETEIRSVMASTMSVFRKAGKMVDALFRFPFKFCKFLSDKGGSIEKKFKKMYVIKQGIGAAAAFATGAAMILEKFIKWISRGTIFLTEAQRDIEWRMFEATCSITTLRSFAECDTAFLQAEPLRKAAFLTSYCALSTFVDTYRSDANPALRSICTVSEPLLRLATPTYRNLCNEEHPSLQYHAYGLALVGAPGVGKTYLSEKIVGYVCRRLKEEFGVEIPKDNQIYSKGESDEFFSGYSDQFATVVDDFCQSTDSKLPPNMYKLVGDAKEHLNMAAIGDKGKTFSSRLVLTTLNGSGYPEPNSVTDHSALWRRRQMLLRVSVNPVYLRPTEYGLRPAPEFWEKDDFWVFEKLNPYHPPGNCIGQPITDKQECFEMIYQEFLAHHIRKYPGKDVFSGEFPIVKTGVNNFLSPNCELLVYCPKDADGAVEQKDVETYYALRGKRVYDASAGTVVITFSEHHTETLFSFTKRQLTASRTEIVQRWNDFWKREGTVSDTMRSLYAKITNAIPEKESWSFWQMLVMMVEAGVIAGLVYYVVKKLVANPQSAVGKDKKIIARTKPLQVAKLVNLEVAAEPQDLSILDESSRRVVKTVVGNSVAIVCPDGDANRALAHATFLCDQYLLMNKHCYNNLRNQRYVQLVSLLSAARWNVNLYARPPTYLGAADWVVVDLRDQAIQPFPDVRKHIVDEDENVVIPGSGVFPEIVDKTLGYEVMRLGFETNYRSALGVGDYYTYPTQSQKGYCGLPVFAFAVNKRLRWVGLHALGYDHMALGMAQPIVAGAFRDVRSIMPPFQYAEEQGSIPVPDGFHQIGFTGAVNFMPHKTSFKPSPISGLVVPVTDAPSVLSTADSKARGNGNHPAVAGLQGYLDPIYPLDQELVMEAAKDVAQFLSMFPGRKEYARVLTDFEMLNGNHLPHLGHIDMTTSPGYPYASQRETPGKYDYIVSEGDTLKISVTPKGRQLADAIEARERAAKEGRRVESVWVDGLKDELLPPEKISISKTRIFVNGPLDHTLLMRKYCGGFTAHMMYNRVSNWTGPGLVESQVDWMLLYKKLVPFSNNIVCGDFSQWDKHLDPMLIKATSFVYNYFYDDGPENARVRDVLFHELAYTKTLCGNMMYITDRANPSGCAVTTPLNNLAQLIILRYLWLLHFRRLGMDQLLPMHVMLSLTYTCVYGDDHIMGVHDSIKDLWNQEVLQKLFAEIGMKYTDISKTSKIAKFCDLPHAMFLKRKFVPFEGACLGVRDINDILSTLNWVRKGEDPKIALSQNIQMVSMEMWKHGEPVYTEWMDKIRVACAQADIPIYIPGYKEHLEKWRSNVFQYGVSAVDHVDGLDETGLIEQEHKRMLGAKITGSTVVTW